MESQILTALETLKKGGIILYPTDTIWGIGCDATNEKAVEKIYKIKRRSDAKSLIVLASDMAMVEQYVEQVPEIAYSLVELNDKPMTIIYPNGVALAENVMAQDRSVGIRIPMSDFCRTLIKRFKRPIVSTSANISGESAPQSYSEITQEIIDAIDFAVSQECEKSSTHKASQIIKVGVGGEIEIIRQ